MFKYGRSISCLPHRPKLSDFFDSCLHWESIICAHEYYQVGNRSFIQILQTAKCNGVDFLIGNTCFYVWDFILSKADHTAPLSDLLLNLWLNKSKRVFSSGGARTHTTRELKFSSLMLYQLSYRGF